MKVHFEFCNGGLKSAVRAPNLNNLAYQMSVVSKEKKTAAQVAIHAAAVYQFITADPPSILRDVLQRLSAGGLAYTTHIHDQVTAAYITVKEITQDDWILLNEARLCDEDTSINASEGSKGRAEWK